MSSVALVALVVLPTPDASALEGGPDGFNYRFVDSDEADGPVYDWVDIRGVDGVSQLTLGDNDHAIVPIGFGFDFYGEPYTEVAVSSNGYLNFDSGGGDLDPIDSSNDCPIYDSDSPDSAIYGFWDDLDPSSGGSIHYHTLTDRSDGSVNLPDQFVVQYQDVPLAGLSETVTFQIILTVGSNEILVQYEDVQTSLATTGGSATMGIEGPSSLATGLQYGACDTAGNVNNGLAVRYSSTLNDRADLRVTQVGLPDSEVYVGQQFRYSIIVDNLGPSRAYNVVVQDTAVTQPIIRSNGCGIAVRTDDGRVDEFDCNFSLGTGVFDLGTFGANWLNPRSTTDQGRVVITIDAVATEAGDIANYVTAVSDTFDPDTSNNDALDVMTAVPAADLGVTKTVTPDPVVAGDTVTYEITATNAQYDTGSPLIGSIGGRADGVVVTDALPAGVSVRSITPSQGSCTGGTPGDADDPLTCALGSIEVDDTATITVEVDVDPGFVTDVVTDTALLSNAVRIESPAYDPNNANDIASATTTVMAEADLGLTQFAVGQAIAGDVFSYEYQVRNLGPSVSRDVTLRSFLPDGVELVSAFVDAEGSAGGTPLACDVTSGSNALFCPLGDIAPTNGVPVLVFVNARIDADVADGTVLETDADVFLTDTPDPDTSNNADEVSVSVQTRADLSVSKTSNVEIGNSSSDVVYTITATNDGPSDAQNVTLVDELPSVKKGKNEAVSVTFATEGCTYDEATHTVTCDLGTIADGASASVEIYVNVKGNPGTISNSVEVSSDTVDPDPGNNTDTDDVTIGGGKGEDDGTSPGGGPPPGKGKPS